MTISIPVPWILATERCENIADSRQKAISKVRGGEEEEGEIFFENIASDLRNGCFCNSESSCNGHVFG